MRIPAAATMVLLVGLLGCQASRPRVDVEAEKAAVRAALEAYISAVEVEDMALYGENVLHDEVMVNFGVFGPPIIGWSGLQEVISGQNDALSEINIAPSDTEVHISESGDQAWATSRWDFNALMGEQPLNLDMRCTWVLKKHDAAWLLVHFHKSVAAG